MPRTLLSQLWHSPEKEQIPARKQRDIMYGASAAVPSTLNSPLCCPHQNLPEDIPAVLHRFSPHLDTSDITVSAWRWQQTSKPVPSIYYDAKTGKGSTEQFCFTPPAWNKTVCTAGCHINTPQPGTAVTEALLPDCVLGCTAITPVRPWPWCPSFVMGTWDQGVC